MPRIPTPAFKSYWPEIERLSRKGAAFFVIFAVFHQGVWRAMRVDGEATLRESLAWTLGRPLWLIFYSAGLCAVCIQTGVATHALSKPRAWSRSLGALAALVLWLLCLHQLTYFATGKGWF